MKRALPLVWLIGTAIMAMIMTSSGRLLSNVTPCGILDLEFAWNVQLANDVVVAWTKGGVHSAAINNTKLDFIFLCFYSLLLYSLCKIIALSSSNVLRKAGMVVAQGALVAGLLDILENIGMLITLYGTINAAIAYFTVLFSLVKWLLVIVALIYLAIGSGSLLFKKTFSRTRLS